MSLNSTNPNAAPASPRFYYGYWLIGAAFVAQFVSVGVQNYVFGPFMTPMIEDLGFSRAEFTSARTVGQVVMGAVGFLIGAQVDRYGGRGIMLLGTAVLAVALFLLAYVETLLGWIVLNGLVLTAGAAMIGNLVVNVTLSKWFVERRGQAVAWAAMGVSFAGLGITPFVTTAIDLWGWRAAWQILAVFTIVLTVPVALMMRRTPEDHGLHPDGKTAAQVADGQAERAAADFRNSLTRAEALRTLTFYLLVLAFGLFTINIGVMLLQTHAFITDAGFSRSTAAGMIIAASIPAMATKPVWGYFVDRVNPKPLAALGAAVTGLSLLFIVWAVSERSVTLTYAAYFMLGVGWGGMIPLQEVIWASFFGRRFLGAVRSAGLPFSLLLGASGPLAAAWYYDVVGNYDGAFITIAIMNLVSGVLILFVRPPRRKT